MKNIMGWWFMDNCMVKGRDGMWRNNGFILVFGKNPWDVDWGNIM